MAHGFDKEYIAFFEMLDQVPRLKHCWDNIERVIKESVFEAELTVLSPGEVHMAKFFAAVWFRDNRYGFDLVDAVAIIDDQHKAIIMKWIVDPFWP